MSENADSNQKVERDADSPEELAKTIIYALLIALVFRTLFFQAFTIPSSSMKPTLLVGDYLLVSKFSYGYSRFSLPFGSRIPTWLGGRLLEGTPERGDVVVFRNPKEPQVDFIKRLVGLPGDKIQLTRGVLLVNGKPAQQQAAPDFLDNDSVAPETMCAPNREGAFVCNALTETLDNGVQHGILPGTVERQGLYRLNTCEYTVPDGHYFMVGDNRTNSADSRFGHRAPYGQTPEGVDCSNLRPGAIKGYTGGGTGYIPADHLVGRAEIVLFSWNGAFWELWNWRASRFFTWI